MKNILWCHVDAFRHDVRQLVNKLEQYDPEGFAWLDENLTKLENCYSHAISTIYSVAGYLTGTFPFNNGCIINDIGTVPDNIKWIGEILREQGYKSKAFITTGPKHTPNWERVGIRRCFDEIEYLHSDKGIIEQQMLSSELFDIKGKEIIDRCNNQENTFTYITLLDMHVNHGRDLDGDWKEFFRGVMEVDYFFRNLLPNINLDKTIVVVHGDHGFKFAFDQAERKAYCNFGDVSGYEPLIKVGAYISNSSGAHISRSINGNFRLVDIFPSIIFVMGFNVSNPINGIPIQWHNGKEPCYSEIGMYDNGDRDIKTDRYLWMMNQIELTPERYDYEISEIKKFPPYSKSNFSCIINDYIIIFDMWGNPNGLFKFKDGQINYSENLLWNKELVLKYCKLAEEFIRESKLCVN